MQIYIAILRGINVSGQKKIKMADLRASLAELGWSDIATYIQSGNVLFRTAETDQADLAEQLAGKIQEKYGFDVPILVKSVEEVREVFGNNPYLTGREEDIAHLHVTFFAEEPDSKLSEAVRELSFLPDEFVLQPQQVYLFCPNGYGRVKITNSFWERKLKVKATTRNWKTVTNLLDMAKEMD